MLFQCNAFSTKRLSDAKVRTLANKVIHEMTQKNMKVAFLHFLHFLLSSSSSSCFRNAPIIIQEVFAVA